MIYFIGVIGYSAKKFDIDLATRYLISAFDSVCAKIDQSDEVYIISGYTDMGIPGIAYRLAETYGWKTVGLSCKKAFENPLYPVDKEIIVGENWGDESETLINISDIMIRIGGGPQAMNEAKLFKEKYSYKPIYEYDLEAL